MLNYIMSPIESSLDIEMHYGLINKQKPLTLPFVIANAKQNQ